MGFRDDHEALRQKVKVLEGEVETLTEELEEARSPKVRVEVDREEVALPTVGSAHDLAARVAAKEKAKQLEEAAAQRRALQRATKRQRKRSREVEVHAREDEKVVVIRRPLWSQIKDQALLALGGVLGIALFAIPLFILLFERLGAAAGLGALLGLLGAAFIALNAVFAYFFRPNFVLRFAGEHFEVLRRGSTVLLGRSRDLTIRVSEPRGSKRGAFFLRHEGRVVAVHELGLDDTQVLQALKDWLDGFS